MAIKRTRESEEMYLETILLLHREHANVRAVDVGEELGYASTPQRGTSPSRKRAKRRRRASMNATACSRRRSSSWARRSTSPKRTPAVSSMSSRTS